MTASSAIRIKSQQDFWSGLLFIAVGIAFAWGATHYSVGQSARMGPGYFPLMLGTLMAIIGVAVTISSLVLESAGDESIGSFAWRPLFFIIAANLAFGVLLGGLPSIGLPHMGLIAATIALTFIAALASDEFDFKEVLILSIILAIGCYLTFIKALNLQFPAWPAFIGR